MDLDGLNNQAVRQALEFVAANRAEITKAQGVATSSASQMVVKEARRERARIIRMLEFTVKDASKSAVDPVVRRRAEEVAYLRRMVEPLSVDKLAEQMAAMLKSDSSIGAKMVAMEVVREQADFRRGRKESVGANVATARRLIGEARASLSTVGVSPEELGWTLPAIGKAEDEPGSENEAESLPVGVQELIRTIREEGAETRKAIHAAAEPGWRENVVLLVIVAGFLVSLASLYLDGVSLETHSTEHSAKPSMKGHRALKQDFKKANKNRVRPERDQ